MKHRGALNVRGVASLSRHLLRRVHARNTLPHDGGDRRALAARRQGEATVCEAAVHEHRAGAAFATAAAQLRAGELQPLAKDCQQRLAVDTRHRMLLAVHDQPQLPRRHAWLREVVSAAGESHYLSLTVTSPQVFRKCPTSSPKRASIRRTRRVWMSAPWTASTRERISSTSIPTNASTAVPVSRNAR